MKYMLDTNICIHIMKHNQNVLSAFSENKSDGVAISSITLAELEFGVCNSGAYERNRVKLINFLSLVDVLPFDGAAAAAYGMLFASLTRSGNQIGKFDALIAAHARSRNMVVSTSNVREFGRVDGLNAEDWTETN